MFAITTRKDLYTTYILSDSAGQSHLEVIPERGGIVTRWQVQNREIFYLDAERLTNPALSVRGGIPILFPICGNLPDDTYTLNGQSYTLKQHGFARDLPWQVIDQTTSDRLSLTVELRSNEETRAVYPFDFQLAFTYILQGGILTVQQEITNHSAEPMPFSVGFHPYFVAPDKTQLELAIPATEFQTKGSTVAQPFTGSFDFEQPEIDVAFGDLNSQTAGVSDRSQSLQLTLDYSDTFSTLVFWAVNGKDFYCLEPWSAPRNAMNTGAHLIHLAPGESTTMMFSLSVDFL